MDVLATGRIVTSTHQEMKIGGVVLAAGESARLGRPKQLLRFEGTTLVHRAVDALDKSGCVSVVAVLGAFAMEVREALSGSRADLVDNDQWREGMSSSIRTGVRSLLAVQPVLDGIIILPCDLPFVGAVALLRLKKAWRGTTSIAAANFDESVGPPVLFGRDYFAELATLAGKGGAKSILLRHPAHVIAVPMPEASHDIDTVRDASTLLE